MELQPLNDSNPELDPQDGTPVDASVDSGVRDRHQEVERPFPLSKRRGPTSARSRTVFAITSDKLTAAHVSTCREGVVVHRLASAPADSSSLRTDGSEIIEAIDIVLSEFPEKPKLVDVILPEDAVKKSVVALPPVKDSKARKVLKNRALQVSGLPEEELLWSARPLGDLESGGKPVTNWLILTISRPSLLRYYDVFRNAGIKVSGFFPATQLLLNLSHVEETQNDVIGEVILGEDLVVFSILKEGSTIFTRSIRFDPDEPKEDRRDILAGELQRSFLYCQQNITDVSPKRVDVLHCGDDRLADLAEQILAQTGVDTHTVDLRSWMRVTGSVDETTVSNDTVMMLLGAGLMYVSNRAIENTNIEPKDLRPRNWSVSAKIATTLAIIEIGLIIYRLSDHIDGIVEKKEAVVAAHQESRRSLRPTLQILDDVEKRDQFLERLESETTGLVPLDYDWPSLFRDVAYLPDGEIHLVEAKIRRSGGQRYSSGQAGMPVNTWSIELQVASPLAFRPAQEILQGYIRNLRQSKYFRSVNAKPATVTRSEGEPDTSRFVVECELN